MFSLPKILTYNFGLALALIISIVILFYQLFIPIQIIFYKRSFYRHMSNLKYALIRITHHMCVDVNLYIILMIVASWVDVFINWIIMIELVITKDLMTHCCYWMLNLNKKMTIILITFLDVDSDFLFFIVFNSIEDLGGKGVHIYCIYLNYRSGCHSIRVRETYQKKLAFICQK